MKPATGTERFSIDQLATLAGVTPRTIRFYISEGLLDRPEGEKRGAHYLRRHLERLLMIRRWTDSGASLDRVRELVQGASEDPPPRRISAGMVEVWSRVTLADGLEVQIEPGRAQLTPEQVRSFVRGAIALYRQVRSQATGARGDAPEDQPGQSTKGQPEGRTE